MSLFLLGYALGQLIYGPFANRFGRKRTLHAGLTIAMVGTIFSLLSSPFESFPLLLFGRFIEAIGSSVGLVVGAIIINDYHFPQAAKSRFAVVMIGIAIVPGVAVMIGGILSQYLNWQACFYFMLFYNAMLYGATFILPETIDKRHSLNLISILSNYKKVMQNKRLLLFGGMVGLTAAFIYIFSAEGPFIGIKVIGLSASTYGFFAILPSVGLFCGGLLARFIINKVPGKRLLFFAFLSDFIAISVLLILFFLHLINIYTLIIPVSLVVAGYPFFASICFGSATSEVENKAIGASIVNFLAVGMPVIATYLITLVHTNNPVVLPISYAIVILIVIVLTLRAMES